MTPTKWRLLPRISYVNYRKEYPQASKRCWRAWFSITRYWGDRLIYVSVRGRTLILDFRANWFLEMLP